MPALAACIVAIAFVPSFARGMLLWPVADLVLVVGLLALARVALALAGMDVGTAFGGLGAAREMSFSAFAEPALLLCALTFAILAGTTDLELIAATFHNGGLGLRVSLALAGVAMLAVAVAENARIPVDNPSTHLELTMVHEAMLLEASGRHLALWEYQAALKLTLWLALLAGGVLALRRRRRPGRGRWPGWSGWRRGWRRWAVCAWRWRPSNCAIAKMRVFRVPEFLGAALLLALLAAPCCSSADEAGTCTMVASASSAYDMVHLLGGGMLLLSFVLLYQRRVTAVINALAVQGAILAAAAGWQGYIQDAPQLYLTALVAFGPRRC